MSYFAKENHKINLYLHELSFTNPSDVTLPCYSLLFTNVAGILWLLRQKIAKITCFFVCSVSRRRIKLHQIWMQWCKTLVNNVFWSIIFLYNKNNHPERHSYCKQIRSFKVHLIKSRALGFTGPEHFPSRFVQKNMNV